MSDFFRQPSAAENGGGAAGSLPQSRAPLWEAMLAYRDRRPARFHVPGHKGGAGLDPSAAGLLAGVFEVDVTELPGLDDLHQPEGVIAEAEELAAKCFGAERTRFLVGGSTAGNLALILAVCKPGDVLLVQRDAHKSVYNGLMLAGAKAVLLSPRIDPASGLPCGIDPAEAEAAMERYPEAKGLFLTDPNYYGFGTDLAPIVAAAHRRGMPVLVDAAHGAHYGFHPAVPDSPLAAGADGVVQSAHKMLTAMTMGALLHMQGDLLDREAVERALSALQSSSPSYPIMASLDLARRQMALSGETLLGRATEAARALREGLAAMPWLDVADAGGGSQEQAGTWGDVAWTHAAAPEHADPPGHANPSASLDRSAGSVTRDPLKVTFRDRTGTLSGHALAGELQARGCYPEMADPVFVTLALGVSTDSGEIRRLLEALHEICTSFRLLEQELGPPAKNIYKSPPSENLHAAPAVSKPVAFSFHSADESVLRRALPEEAIGAVCGRPIVPYPPGVPLIVPGETITADAVRRLKAWQSAGLGIHGLNHDGTLIIRTNGDQP